MSVKNRYLCTWKIFWDPGHPVENLPLAMFPNIEYDIATVDLGRGDVLAVVTDGLTEIFDSKNRELGDDSISKTLSVAALRPLKEIADGILHFARDFGKTTNDQPLLCFVDFRLVRLGNNMMSSTSSFD